MGVAEGLAIRCAEVVDQSPDVKISKVMADSAALILSGLVATREEGAQLALLEPRGFMQACGACHPSRASADPGSNEASEGQYYS